nr:immunoglobulin heavy chain junction region [Macaca mulatta]MOX58918.1 immunoglobulin heavy chain junction region [Macaca mulatta]MOX59242.1 immunoglobulin heavy chain junction region [Macaca mulatta]MOX59951.1 immunoglobulin heavy chain junction region [Macaca mulatta]MOX60055.1 immunoglobulin heavy chain junction region [Macaca mulatta]
CATDAFGSGIDHW